MGWAAGLFLFATELGKAFAEQGEHYYPADQSDDQVFAKEWDMERSIPHHVKHNCECKNPKEPEIEQHPKPEELISFYLPECTSAHGGPHDVAEW